MKIRLAGDIVFDSIVDGTGLRATVFTQGCPHHCPGCHNPQTWKMDGGFDRTVEEVVEEIAENELNPYVTFSGGDPFEQPIECLNVLLGLRIAGKSNFWAYTGYTWEELTNPLNTAYSEDKVRFLENLDTLVDGKYCDKLHSHNILYRGSTNQRIIDVQESLKEKRIVVRNDLMKQ